MYRPLLLAAVLVVGACSSSAGDRGATDAGTRPAGPRPSASTAPPSASGPDVTAPALPSLPSGAGANSGKGVCGAFSADEIGRYAKKPARAGEVSGPLNTACSWDTDGNGNVLIQVVPADYWEPHNTAGHRALTGIGTEAFVEASMFGGGWVAVAKDEGKVIYVDMTGAQITADDAVALLTEAVKRLP